MGEASSDQSKPAEGRRFHDRAALVRLAFGTIVLIGALFVFVFPTRALLSQRSTISETQQQVNLLHRENAALGKQAQQLQSGTAVDRIARERYDMVRPGEQAWVVVPAPAATTTTLPAVTTAPATTAPAATGSARRTQGGRP
jgi:cell division protein FtsB